MFNVAIMDRFRTEGWYSFHLATELSKILSARGGTLYLYASRKDNPYKVSQNCMFERVWTSGLYPFQIAGHCRKDGIKILHLQFEFAIYGSFLGSMLVPFLLMLSRILGVETVVTLHGPIFSKNTADSLLKALLPPETRMPLPLFKAYIIMEYLVIYLLSSAIIVHGDQFREWLREYGIRDTYVIPHGVPEEKLDVSPYLLNHWRRKICGKGIILFSGVLSPRKGIEYLLQAISKQDTDKRIKLVIAGAESPTYRGYGDKLRVLASELRISDKVIFTGFVTEPSLHALFAIATIVVLPYVCSVSACGPLSLAIQNGKPVVATATEYFREELENGKTALLVPERDSDALAKAIDALVTDTGLRERLAYNIRLNAKTKSWTKVAQMTFELYQELS
jgi:glycosyltransferase involved in cell wall biosynthesis